MGQKEIFINFDTVKLLLFKLMFLKNALLRISPSPELLNCVLRNVTESQSGRGWKRPLWVI